jgi:hypothetical protein
MPGRGFLDVARDSAAGPSEFHWRSATVDAYYALFLECRDTLFRWGFVHPRRDNIHTWVRLRLTYSRQSDLKQIADALDKLVRRRNHASYDFTPSTVFASPVAALDAIQQAIDALALLDPIDIDPIQRAAAIPSIPP